MSGSRSAGPGLPQSLSSVAVSRHGRGRRLRLLRRPHPQPGAARAGDGAGGPAAGRDRGQRYDGAASDVHPTAADVAYLLDEARALLPATGIEREHVRYAFAGLRPLMRAAGGPEAAISRKHEVVDHARRGGPAGLLSVIGGKLSTFRPLAGGCGGAGGARQRAGRAIPAARAPLADRAAGERPAARGAAAPADLRRRRGGCARGRTRGAVPACTGARKRGGARRALEAAGTRASRVEFEFDTWRLVARDLGKGLPLEVCRPVLEVCRPGASAVIELHGCACYAPCRPGCYTGRIPAERGE